ncbi:hypothetical protein [Desulfonema limicola]|uniref:hypothetical protein n=1 Tax=Desulfonema limicola TaxID=45656 RepID=UPI001A9B0034|nr:hypothetical protein [Desulfonema limicola]
MLHGILSLLEPDEVKVSSPVLRGLGDGNIPRLPDVDGAFAIRSTQSIIPPADRQILSHRVKSVEHGKPDCLRKCGNRPARAGHRQAGMGSWKKRMPCCNGADRGSKFALTRKSADFQQVANYEKDYKRYNHSCTADDGKDH